MIDMCDLDLLVDLACLSLAFVFSLCVISTMTVLILQSIQYPMCFLSMLSNLLQVRHLVVFATIDMTQSKFSAPY